MQAQMRAATPTYPRPSTGQPGSPSGCPAPFLTVNPELIAIWLLIACLSLGLPVATLSGGTWAIVAAPSQAPQGWMGSGSRRCSAFSRPQACTSSPPCPPPGGVRRTLRTGCGETVPAAILGH